MKTTLQKKDNWRKQYQVLAFSNTDHLPSYDYMHVIV